MNYTTTSIREVIGRIVRNTRLQDAGMIVDMQEWIPEAMEMMHTRHVYSPFWKDVEIIFNKAKMPCGIIVLDSVEHNGVRVDMDRSARSFASNPKFPNRGIHAHAPNEPFPDTQDFYETVILQREGPEGDPGTFYESTAVPVCTSRYKNLKYQVEPGYLVFPIQNGWIRIHGRRTPMDNEGFPLIPDNGHYKEALYWYVRAKMYGAGYDEKQYKLDYMDQKFQDHAKWARAEIRYPSVDEIASSVGKLSQFNWPVDYFETFDNPDNYR